MAAAEHHDESVRELDQIRHTNETISHEDTYRAQTEASNIQIVTPHYKSGEKPDSEVHTGASAAELNARFAETNGDYKAERSQEHFRMQIIDPKVNSNAHLPAHAPREYARKKLIEDFPSLHGKRSFLDLDALEQRSIRKNKPIPMSEYLTKSIDRHPKKDDFSDLDKLRQSLDALQKAASQPKDLSAPPATIKAQSNEELDELARLSREIEQRSKSRRAEYKVEKLEPEIKIWEQKAAAERSERYSENYLNSIVIHLEEPTPAPPVIRTVVRQEPIRREVVEVRREVKPKITQNVKRFEEKKRTEEVERRVIRRERRHKSSRIRYGHGSSGHHQEFHDWNNRGLRSSSAASRNGFGSGGGGDYYYHGSSRHGGGGGDTASDRFFQQNRASENARYGSLSDSLRRGDLKYGPNGDVRENGHHHHQNGYTGNEKYSSAKRVHKSYSTRDVFHDGGYGGSGYGHQPLVEFPPTLPRHGANYHHETHQNGYNAPAPPPHRSHNGFTSDYYGGGSSGYGSGRLTKSRSYADWDGSRGGPFGSGVRRYDDDMARLENEFRDSLLMKLPTNGGNMNEKDYRHQEIPGGYETYEREVKASSGRKLNPEGLPTDFKDSTQGYNYKRETQR